MKDHALFQGQKIHEDTLTKFKNFLQNHMTNFNQTWHKATYGKGDSSLFELMATTFFKGK